MFAASAGIVWARQPRQRIDYLGSSKLDDLIPQRVGRWEFASTSGLVVPPEDKFADTIYSQVLTRVYADEISPPVMLLIAQSAGQTGILQIHRPEACYPAGGYRLSNAMARALQVGPATIRANQLTATAPGRQEQILYWTRVGDAMPGSWADQRLTVARDNLKGQIPDAVLVRLSTIDPDRNSATERLGEFAAAMLASLPDAGRRVLVA